MDVTKKWVVEQGVGHWEISFNGFSLTCDDNIPDISETTSEVLEIGKVAAVMGR